LLYNINDLIIDTEIINFILATQQFTGATLSDVSFDVAAIQSLTPAQQDIVLDSMIVRNILTEELESNPLYVADPNNYHQNNTSYFMTEAGIRSVLGI
jgi:hypothetical protein